MSEQARAIEVIKAEMELLQELLGALERGREAWMLQGLPVDEVDGPRELARRIRDRGYVLVLRRPTRNTMLKPLH